MSMYVNWDELIKYGDLVESKIYSGRLGVVVECYHYPTIGSSWKRAWALCTVRWISSGRLQYSVPDNQLIKIEPLEEK